MLESMTIARGMWAQGESCNRIFVILIIANVMERIIKFELAPVLQTAQTGEEGLTAGSVTPPQLFLYAQTSQRNEICHIFGHILFMPSRTMIYMYSHITIGFPALH